MAALWWSLCRLVALVLYVRFENVRPHDVGGDVNYFSEQLAYLTRHGLAHTLVEYPVPAVLLLAIPWLAAQVLVFHHSFLLLFSTSTVALDAAFTVVLVRRRAHRTATATWIIGVPLLGALSYLRFDLLPSVLVGFAVLTLAERPRLTQVVVAIATAIKLWPALLIPPVVAFARQRRKAVAVIVGVGAGLAVLTVGAAGWTRLISPLAYQAHRGLQIESVWATPAMIGWGFGPSRWRVFFSSFKAVEVAGYGVPELLTASSLSALVVATALATLWWRLLRRPGAITPEDVAWVSLAGVAGFVVTTKVFSPQYLLWLLALVVAGLAVSNGARAFRIWAVVLMAAIALTHGYIPEAYQGLNIHTSVTSYSVSVLVARNALMLWLLVSAFQHAWRATTVQAGSTPDRSLRGSGGDRAPEDLGVHSPVDPA